MERRRAEIEEWTKELTREFTGLAWLGLTWIGME
jgi:hypothetical protein